MYTNGKLFSCEVHAFGTLIMSTKVFRLIICKTIWPRHDDPYLTNLDFVPKQLLAHNQV